MSCKLKKNKRDPIVPLTFQRLCDDYQCLFLLFSVIYLDSWGYTGGVPVWVFEKFCDLFSSFSFLFFLFLFFFFCLSLGGSFNSGAPGHCLPMPPSCYATECIVNDKIIQRYNTCPTILCWLNGFTTAPHSSQRHLNLPSNFLAQMPIEICHHFTGQFIIRFIELAEFLALNAMLSCVLQVKYNLP